MSHCISGIVTSFKYKGELPHVYLVGNYALLPLDRFQDGLKDYPVDPFENMNPKIKKIMRDLSFNGLCSFIETDFFGGCGTQKAVVYENGKVVLGPLISLHSLPKNLTNFIDIQVSLVDEAVNQALQFIGILRSSEKDEFDTARLGWFRSNEEILSESQLNADS